MKSTKKFLGIFGGGKDAVMKTSESHPHEVDYVDSSIKEEVLPNGRIGMMMCPGRSKKSWRRDLDVDVERIKKEFEVNVVITLVRTKELEKMGMGNNRFFQKLKDEDIECRHHPIKDKWLPKSSYLLCQTLEYIVEKLQEEKNIAVHCNGGKGRSGLIIACVLVSRGVQPSKAISTVKKTRGGTLKNPLQQAYIYKFPKTWKKFVKGTLKKPKGKTEEEEFGKGEDEEEEEGEEEELDPRMAKLRGLELNKTV